jgi:hypothetical protein
LIGFTADWLVQQTILIGHWSKMGKAAKSDRQRHKKFIEKEFGTEEVKKDPLKSKPHEFKQSREKLENLIETFNFDDDENEMKVVKPGQAAQKLGKIQKNQKKMTKKQKKHAELKKEKAEKYGEMLEKKVLTTLKKGISKLK